MPQALPSCGAPVLLPRWEWRTFAPALDCARKLQDMGTRLGSSHDREISLISLTSSHDVTIRDHRMALKWRKQSGQDGLELWDVVLDSAFPCAQDIVRRLFEAWGIPLPILHRPYYTIHALLLEVIQTHPNLRVVDIEKHAESFSVQGARCEWTRLLANHVPCECLSIEHEDPCITLQVMRSLGLEARPHASYPTGLKSALHLNTQH